MGSADDEIYSIRIYTIMCELIVDLRRCRVSELHGYRDERVAETDSDSGVGHHHDVGQGLPGSCVDALTKLDGVGAIGLGVELDLSDAVF